jgi:hypothetical protein
LRAKAMGGAWVALAALLAARSLQGQLVSDDVPRERIIPPKDQVLAEMQSSRLSLGPLRLIPVFGVSNAGYDSNVFGTATDQVSDWTFTVFGGLRWVIPFGSKVYLRGSALPNYTWYDKLKERRSVGGFYDASLLGFFNRMTVQLSGYGSESFEVYSSELATRVKTTIYDASGAVEVDLAGPFSIFGRGEAQKFRYSPQGQLPGVEVDANDRTDTAARGGLRYKLAADWDMSAAFEQTWSDFVQDAGLRNNLSRAYLFGFHYERPRLYVNLSGGYREGRPKDDSAFPSYETGTGSFFVSFFPLRWLELQGYGRRRVGYSLTSTNPYYFENRIGGGINVEILSRVLLRGLADTGPNQYPLPQVVDGALIQRRDQARTYGGGASIIVARPLVLTGLVTRDEYHSNIPGESRTVTRYRINASFNGQFSR